MGRFGALKIPATVGVIASPEELRTAIRMRRKPDLFELRLDYLPGLSPREIFSLRRPLIITARHPAEDGGGRRRQDGGSAGFQSCGEPAASGILPNATLSRRDLLLKWLSFAQFVDVELRSLHELGEVWDEAARLKIKRICSIHDFARTPSHSVLQKQFQRAKKAGADIFKLVTRADTFEDLFVLAQFLRCAGGHCCCVMATGKFGPVSRLLFGEFGSALVYAPLCHRLYPGQITLAELRRYSPRRIRRPKPSPRIPNRDKT
jgi:3-dehydroquinate dehydratase